MIVDADLRVPGDKSITHRALLLSAFARGESRIEGALTSLDARSSARVLRQLGAAVSPLAEGEPLPWWAAAAFAGPWARSHCGNSGTTTRLLLGLLAAHPFAATLTGDRSLRRRPMRRVTIPLELMGARFAFAATDGLPVTVRGGKLRSLRYELRPPARSSRARADAGGCGGGRPGGGPRAGRPLA